MHQEDIAWSVNNTVEVVVEFPFFLVRVGVNELIVSNVMEDISNTCDEVVINVLHGLGRPTKSHAEARITIREGLDVGTDLEGGRERAQDRNVMTILRDIAILDLQSLNIVQTNSSYLKVLEGNT
jgi:hypothetical protein